MGGKQKYAVIIPFIALGEACVFFYAMYLNNCPEHSRDCLLPFIQRFSFEAILNNPLLGPLSKALGSMGALEAEQVTKHRQGWRLITSIWLHSGLIHLLTNCIGLSIVGTRLEKKFGLLKVGFIYLLSGFAGSVVSAIFVRDQYIAAASGGTCGLMGSTLSSLLLNWFRSKHKAEILIQLFCLLTLDLCLGLTPHLDNFAHLGGLGVGFLLGFVLLMRPRRSAYIHGGSLPEDPAAISSELAATYRYTYFQRLWQFFTLLACVAGYAAAIGVLYDKFNVSAKCTSSYCKYLSCISTNTWSC